MPQIQVRDMTAEDEYFVSTCSHVNESEETDAYGCKSRAWLLDRRAKGLRVKVALLDGAHAGFLFAMPAEIAPNTFMAKDMLVFPCLWVLPDLTGRGIGKALLDAAESEARHQGAKALATAGHYGDFWFMPATFFEKHGYTVAAEDGKRAILWKVFDASAEAPRFLQSKYEFQPVAGKVVVDLFWFTLCQTVGVEAQRVREVAAEFGDAVVLNEYCSDEREVLLRYEQPRGIFINGKEIGWGYEAPKEGVRKAIAEAVVGLQA